MSADPAARPRLPALLPAPNAPRADVRAPRPPRAAPPAGPDPARRPQAGAARAPLTPWAWALAAAVGALHLAANHWTAYGLHRDELLYLAMGQHLELWRMDFPPFIALAAQFTRGLAGDARVAESVTTVQLLPAAAHALLVLLAAVLARELGGRRGPQLLAAGAVAASPMFLRTGTLFQPVVFDQLWWTLGFVALVRLGRRAERGKERDAPLPEAAGRPRWWPTPADRDWLLLGLAVGLGLLTKFSVAFFAAGALAGVLVTPPLRRALHPASGTRAPWAAAALALLVGLPSVVGQVRLGWPVAGQMAALQAGQLSHMTPGKFLLEQLMHGPGALLALGGLAALLAPRRPAVGGEAFRAAAARALAPLRAGRAGGVAALVAVLLLLVGRGKAYYAGPVYPLLWAAGAAALGTRRWGAHPDTRAAHRQARLRLAGAAALFGAYGLVALPLGLPVVPPAPMARYAARLGVGTETNTGGRLALPQDYADMLGWPAQAAAVADVFYGLTPAERGVAVVAATNYGRAGALALYGPRLGLPPVISSAGSFWFFGPGDRTGQVAVVLAGAGASEFLARLFGSVRAVRRVEHPDLRWVVDEERDVWIYLCTEPRQPLQAAWPSLAGQN